MIGAVICFAGAVYVNKAKALPFGAHLGGFLVCFVLWLFLIGMYLLLLQKLSGGKARE